jgi:hypothetical protein
MLRLQLLKVQHVTDLASPRRHHFAVSVFVLFLFFLFLFLFLFFLSIAQYLANYGAMVCGIRAQLRRGLMLLWWLFLRYYAVEKAHTLLHDLLVLLQLGNFFVLIKPRFLFVFAKLGKLGFKLCVLLLRL